MANRENGTLLFIFSQKNKNNNNNILILDFKSILVYNAKIFYVTNTYINEYKIICIFFCVHHFAFSESFK